MPVGPISVNVCADGFIRDCLVVKVFRMKFLLLPLASGPASNAIAIDSVITRAKARMSC